MIGWLREWWYARQRKLDLEYLWPACRYNANGDIDLAKGAFAKHAFDSPAWQLLGNDGIWQVIDHLA